MNSYQKRKRRRAFDRFMRLPIHDRIVALLAEESRMQMLREMVRQVDAEFAAEMNEFCLPREQGAAMKGPR